MTLHPLRVFLLECAGCGGCALEARAALTRPYRKANQGIRVVETPAHADVLVLCGPVPAPLAEAVRHIIETAPPPCPRVRLGDCAWEGSDRPLVAGCPPEPEAILAAIMTAWKNRGRREEPR